MDAVTVNHATQNLNHLIGQVISNVEPTIICNDKGERALLMSMDEFNSWQETLYLLSNPANAEHLRESIAQAKMGKTQERKLIEP
ncbi:MAG: antitoxin [Gammaproteobacteria bacterium]|nr:MAG: antitoxin [Gammaproteobacteria bacterium]